MPDRQARWATVSALWRSPTLRNAGFLYVSQISNLAVQAIVLPFLVRALQPDAFGKYLFFQAIAQYAVLFVDFGFQLTATKHIAEIRDDREATSRYVWTVLLAKALLGILAAAVLSVGGAGLLSTPDRSIFFASLITLVGSVITPLWLFSGLERMVFITASLTLARLATVPAIIFFVRDPADAWVAALIMSAGSILAGLLASYFVFRRKLVALRRPDFRSLGRLYGEGWHLFVSTSAVSLYLTGNIVILGVVSNPAQVGVFGACDRIRQFACGPLTPLSGAYFPRISRRLAVDREDAARMLRRLLRATSVLMGVISAILFLSAPWLSRWFLGDTYADAGSVLAILAPIPFIVGFSTVYGTLALIPLGLKRDFTKIVLACGLLNVVTVGIGGAAFGARGAAGAFLISETLVSVLMFARVRRTGLLEHIGVSG